MSPRGLSLPVLVAAGLLALNALFALFVAWQLLAGRFGPAGG
jgi:hypothetical protein